MRKVILFSLLTGLLFFPEIGNAVLFYSTGDPSYNTNAPAGELEGSGWQFQGRFQVTASDGYLGAPISPHHFITAAHLPSANVGDSFFYGGKEYTTTEMYSDAANSDLMLWKVNGTFASYAPIYSGTGEASKDCVIFGRGTQRGDAVVVNGSAKGWEWGSIDYVVRWGENRVDSTTTIDGLPVLRMDFDSNGSDNECMLSVKDSGGGLFIEEDGVWKLAGISSSISPSTFSYSSAFTNTNFKAALFDYSFKSSDSEKLYYGVGSYAREGRFGPSQVAATYPCVFFSSRVSSRYSWITNNIPDFDQDTDGLPDWWERLYTGDATSMSALADPDSDHFTNYDEWLADTVPTNGDSFLDIVEYTNATYLVFSSSTNREYQMQVRADLTDTNEVWQTEVDWFIGSPTQTMLSVSNPTSNNFYRVRARVQ